MFWKFDRWLPMPVIAIINTWKWFGISTVILLAGLYTIDSQLYEAPLSMALAVGSSSATLQSRS